MLELEEKSHHRLPMSLPKSKDRASDDMEEDEERESPTTGQHDDEDSNGEENIVDLLPAL